ncbi:hypothetical protein Tco_0286408 [Tanacetum coccineum]
MDNCHSIGTPLATKPKLDVDLSGEPVDQSDYRSKIGSLMYLTSSRPDLVQAVCYCARYQARPTQKHLKEVKRIFKYLKGTINMGLWYPKDSGFELTAFSDADHAGCIDTRKSTSGGIQFLGDKLVENGIIELYFVITEYQLAGHVSKALPEDRFKYLIRRIGIRCLTPADLEVVRLGINPMIQPEPEDLPKDNPKLEIAVLSVKRDPTEFNQIHNKVLDSIPKNDHFDAKSYLLESPLNHNTLTDFSHRNDPLHHEFAGEIITNPSRIAREHEEYISRMWLLCGNSSSRSPENFHASPNTIIESLPIFPIPVQDSDSHREEIDIFLGPDDLIPPEIERDDYDSEDDENSTVDEPVLLHTPFPDEDECFDPGGDNDEIDAFLAIEVPTYIEEGYYDSDGDVLYLERLLIDDTTHNLFSEVLFDHEPQCFKDESEFDTLKNMVKTFDPGIYEKTFSPSCVRLSSKDHHYLFFTIVVQILFTHHLNFLFSFGEWKDTHFFRPDIFRFSFFLPRSGGRIDPKFSKDSRVRCFVPVHSSFLAFACH